MKRNKWAAFSIVGVACLVGFFVMAGGRTVNPPVSRGKMIHASFQIPPAVDATLRRACFDCHSYETRWPWYTRLPLASSLIASDVESGRQAMNFSDWPEPGSDAATFAAGMLLSACEAVRTSRMPPPRYLALHPGSRLSKPEIDTLCSWTQRQATTALVAASRSAEASAK